MKNLIKNLLLTITLFHINTVRAVDGVIEINQTCAVHTGCLENDTAGFPVLISGNTKTSFRLTSDLVLPDVDTNGISISAMNITIDFNGYSIKRSGCNSSCASIFGSGSGIVINSSGYSGALIKNGSISGMGLDGIRSLSGDQITVDSMRVYRNGSIGIRVGKASIVKNNIVFDNKQGIATDYYSLISKNNTYSNLLQGISSQNSQIEHNIISNNGEGVSGYGSMKIVDNTILYNRGHGISIRVSAFETSRGAMIQDNQISGNDEYGIKIISGTRHAFKGNMITNNFSGSISGSIFNLGDNFCISNDVCP